MTANTEEAEEAGPSNNCITLIYGCRPRGLYAWEFEKGPANSWAWVGACLSIDGAAAAA